MRPRTIKIGVSLMGMSTMPLATVTVKKFADQLKQGILRVCPICEKKPSYVTSKYECLCGETFTHWSKLKPLLMETGEELAKPRLIEEKAEVIAEAYVMTLEEFSKFVDATSEEYGLTVKDEASAKNLKKLLIATKRLGKVVIIRYSDTYEQRVALLTVSISGRVILREIIPLNLVDIKETLKVDLKDVNEKELKEAEQFVGMLPHGEESNLKVDDYRINGLKKKKMSEKVVELKEIIEKAKIAQKIIS